MVDVVELGPGQSPPEHEDWVLVYVAKDEDTVTGSVITTKGTTFRTRPSSAESEIENAQTHARENGLRVVYVQREA